MFGNRPDPKPSSFQVIFRLAAVEPQTREDLETAATDALSILVDRARGDLLGPVAGCNFDNDEIEIEATIEAMSAEELHHRIGHAIQMLIEHGPFELQGSTTSRIDPEREVALA
jgi:hypothetical protein